MVKTLLVREASRASSKLRPLLRHQQADALDGQERRMAFVHVIDGGPQAQLLQRPQSADAQNDLLPDALVMVAARKAGR